MKNRQFDDVLEIIPHLCRFEGCQVFVKTNDDHEKWCGYRKTDCKVHACEWKGCVTDLAEHFQKDHTESIHIERNKFKMEYIKSRPLQKESQLFLSLIGSRTSFLEEYNK